MVVALPACDDEDLAFRNFLIDLLQVCLIVVLLGNDFAILSDISGDAGELAILSQEGGLDVERLLCVDGELFAWAILSAVDCLALAEVHSVGITVHITVLGSVVAILIRVGANVGSCVESVLVSLHKINLWAALASVLAHE